MTQMGSVVARTVQYSTMFWSLHFKFDFPRLKASSEVLVEM